MTQPVTRDIQDLVKASVAPLVKKQIDSRKRYKSLMELLPTYFLTLAKKDARFKDIKARSVTTTMPVVSYIYDSLRNAEKRALRG